MATNRGHGNIGRNPWGGYRGDNWEAIRDCPFHLSHYFETGERIPKRKPEHAMTPEEKRERRQIERWCEKWRKND